MRKIAIGLILVAVAGAAWASLPIKTAAEKLAVYVNPPLDSSGLPVEASDSMWVMTWSDNGTATRYEARSTTAPFSDIGFDTTLTLYAGLTNLRYVYNQTISTIDGTAGNFVLAGTITAFTKGLPTHTNFAVQVVADSLSKVVSLMVAYLDATISSRSTLAASDNIGLNWGDITNPTTVVGLSGTTILKSSNVDNINSADTLTTVLGNVNGSVGSVTGKVTLVDSSANDIAMVGNAHPTDSTNAANAAASAKAAQDTINAHAPHDNNWGGTAASSLDSGIVQRIVDNNMTPDSVRDIFGDSVSTFAQIAAFADSVRKIFGDSTSAWKDSVLNALANKDNFGRWTAAQLDSVLQSLDYTNNTRPVVRGTADRVLAVAADGSVTAGSLTLSDADIDTIAARTAALVGQAGLYPILERVAVVDAPGAIPKRQFVLDSTSTGGANEYGLGNKAITIRDADDGKYFSAAIIERVNCTADQCTLQTADSLSFAAEAGDTVWFWGDRPAYVQATLSEAADSFVAFLVRHDMTGVAQDSLFGGLLKIAALAGVSTLDTAQFLTMLNNHQWDAVFDSLIYRVRIGNSNSLPVLADLFTQAEFEAFSMNIGKIKGDTTLVIDTSRNAGSGSCPDDGGYVVTIYAYDNTTAAVVQDVTIRTGTTFDDLDYPVSTGVSGYVQYSFNSGWHYLSGQGNGIIFDLDSVNVTGAMTDTIFGASTTIASPPDVSLCTVYGYIESGGSPASDIAVRLKLTRPDTLTIDSNYVEFDETVYTDNNGVWQKSMYFLSGSTRNFYYTYTDDYGRILYFRPTATGTWNVKNIMIPKP